MKTAGLYIHVPFCVQKCAYCDFPSFAGKNAVFQRYTDALCRELKEKSLWLDKGQVSSVFIGGGTPTVLPSALLGRIVETVFEYYSLKEGAEVTAEANPGTLSKDMLTTLFHVGVNRLSIGLQAWQDNILKELGRIHTTKIFLENYDMARKAGFQNINVDLMFSLPRQTTQDWEETLVQVTKLEPEHISAYSLIIEPGTAFWTRMEQGLLSMPDEDTDRQMYAVTKDLLKTKGYEQYEISNFAKLGKESRHNILYWQDKEYLGVGLGAHSYWEGERFHNPDTIDGYIKAVEEKENLTVDRECLSVAQQQAEFMFMGLRMTKGIEKQQFEHRFGISVMKVFGKEIKQLVAEDLLIEENELIRLTDKGMDLANYVFEKFILY